MNIMNIRSKSILLLTHYFAYGPAEDLEWYFTTVEPVKNLIVVKIPLYLSSSSNTMYYTIYERGRLAHRLNLSWYFGKHGTLSTILPEILHKLPLYLYSVLKIGIDLHEGIDIAIAEDPLTTFIAIQLKRKGYVDNVVFHSHSYSIADPRYLDPVLKRFYSFIDYYATKFSDITWALSSRLARIRRALGAKNVIQVPICIRDDIVDHCAKYAREKDDTAVFIGVLNEAKGADLLARAVPYIANVFSKVHIIGRGPLAPLFKKLSEKYQKKVLFHGLKPLKDSAKIAAKSILGFTLSRLSAELLTTDPMKPKVYLAMETPTIIPKYFEIANIVSKYNGGIVMNKLSVDEIINAIRLFKRNQDFYVEGARRIAERFKRWKCSNILSSAMEATMKALGYDK